MSEDAEETRNIPIGYDVADIVWVKLGGHPWWPSLIIRDPNDPMRSFTKINGSARVKRMYFVVFYGSTADFAWVAETTMIPYKGVAAFAEYAQEVVDKAPTKSHKEQLIERFQLKITMNRRDDWELAVKEADQALSETSDKRLEQIDPKIEFYTAKLKKSANVDESSMKIDDEMPLPTVKRRQMKKTKTDETIDAVNGKKRGRPRAKEQTDESSPPPATKKFHCDSPWTNVLLGRSNFQFENRLGFLSPFEENEIIKVIDQSESIYTFDEAEKLARRRYEEILCLNLNRSDVEIPEEWFYSFLFAHPILVVKNEHWFQDTSMSDLVTNLNASTNLTTLKQQLTVIAKFYQNQLELRPRED